MFDTMKRTRWDSFTTPTIYATSNSVARKCCGLPVDAIGDVEADGEFVVVVRADVKYRGSARYDDVLRVQMRIAKIGRAESRSRVQNHAR